MWLTLLLAGYSFETEKTAQPASYCLLPVPPCSPPRLTANRYYHLLLKSNKPDPGVENPLFHQLEIQHSAFHEDGLQQLRLRMASEREFAIKYYSLFWAFFDSPTKSPERKSCPHQPQDTNEARYLMGHCTYMQGRFCFSRSILDVGR